jgi:UDP-2,3-diacylglucosamine pyrophosphatase LpxH
MAQVEVFMKDTIANKDNIAALVLIGDVCEVWHCCLLEEMPPTIDELLQKQPDLQKFGALVREVADSGVPVVYMSGNHDDNLVTVKLQQQFFGDKVKLVRMRSCC